MFQVGDRVIVNNKIGYIKDQSDIDNEFNEIRVWWEKPQLSKCFVFKMSKVKLATEENIKINQEIESLPIFKIGDRVIRKNRKSQVGVVVGIYKTCVKIRWEKSFIHFSAGAIDTHSTIKKTSLERIE